VERVEATDGGGQAEELTPDVLTPSHDVDSSVPDGAAEAEAGAEGESPYAGLPWDHPPTAADKACWGAIFLVTVYAILVMVFRPRLITWSPALAAAITGGRSSVVATGAFAHVYGSAWATTGSAAGDGSFGPAAASVLAIWVVAALALVKFSWIYWWAGHLWGEGIIGLWAGQTERSKRRAARAVAVTQRYWWVAVFLTFLPLPFPMPVVFAAIGAAGIKLRRFLVPVIASSLVLQAVYLALGWWIGEPVVVVVDVIARYLLWITLALVVGTIAVYWWRERKKPA
jgi:membrane protein DedA with SNARE-associated domain